MRLTICLTAAVVLSVSSAQASAHPAHAKAASFQLDGTTWLYTGKDGAKLRESVDADGKYIVQTRAGKHVDHGTAVMKDGKACFTSAMTKDGQICWTTSPVSIGHSLHAVSDKGEKLTVTRVAYTPLKMPH
jgi:hypothetical protein